MAGACHPQHLRAILNIIRGCSGDYDLQTQCMYMDRTHTSRERHEHQGSATHKGMRTKALSTKWACASATVCQLLNLNVVTFQWFTAQPLLTNRLFCNCKRQMSTPPRDIQILIPVRAKSSTEVSAFGLPGGHAEHITSPISCVWIGGLQNGSLARRFGTHILFRMSFMIFKLHEIQFITVLVAGTFSQRHFTTTTLQLRLCQMLSWSKWV